MAAVGQGSSVLVGDGWYPILPSLRCSAASMGLRTPEELRLTLERYDTQYTIPSMNTMFNTLLYTGTQKCTPRSRLLVQSLVYRFLPLYKAGLVKHGTQYQVQITNHHSPITRIYR